MDFTELRHLAEQIETECGRAIIGKGEQIRLVLTSLFAGGHVLIDDIPGVGKTTLVKALSGRDYVTPDDVKYLARYVLPHRVLLSHQAALSGLEAAGVVETVLAQVPCRETGEVLAHGQNA